MDVFLNVIGFLALMVWVTCPVWISQWGKDSRQAIVSKALSSQPHKGE